MWKYGRARAYRVVLLETGHLCQTFCLTATRLGLAPFSTAALKDSLIEKTLGLDGISESILYVAGVGLVSGRRNKLGRRARRRQCDVNRAQARRRGNQGRPSVRPMHRPNSRAYAEKYACKL